jgi:hypothetical protein
MLTAGAALLRGVQAMPNGETRSAPMNDTLTMLLKSGKLHAAEGERVYRDLTMTWRDAHLSIDHQQAAVKTLENVPAMFTTSQNARPSKGTQVIVIE